MGCLLFLPSPEPLIRMREREVNAGSLANKSLSPDGHVTLSPAHLGTTSKPFMNLCLNLSLTSNHLSDLDKALNLQTLISELCKLRLVIPPRRGHSNDVCTF